MNIDRFLNKHTRYSICICIRLGIESNQCSVEIIDRDTDTVDWRANAEHILKVGTHIECIEYFKELFVKFIEHRHNVTQVQPHSVHITHRFVVNYTGDDLAFFHGKSYRDLAERSKKLRKWLHGYDP